MAAVTRARLDLPHLVANQESALHTSISAVPPGKAKSMDHALQHLRAKIMFGTLSPGEQIRQREMAEELGVSRVPLREALNVLADQGLLIHKPNSGYFVAKREPNDHAQILRMLQLLENELLASIEWPDAECEQALRALNQRMRECVDASDWVPLVRLNREFHLKIFERSPHRLILVEVKRLWTLAEGYFATVMSDSTSRARTIEEHEALIDCLMRRDLPLCMEMQEFHRVSTTSALPRTVTTVAVRPAHTRADN